MDEIEVTARLIPKGGIFPVSFKWQEKIFKVDSIGRRWDAKDGEHILVMDMDSRVFHLVFNSAKTTWKLIQRGESDVLAA